MLTTHHFFGERFRSAPIRGRGCVKETVLHVREHVQRLADQSASDQQGYVKWSKYMDEQQGILNAHVETLTKAYNELARLLDAG